MIEVVTQHSGPQGSGLRTIMFFNGETIDDVAAAQADVRTFWQSIGNETSTQFRRTVFAESRLIDAATGGVLDVLTNPTPGGPVVGTKPDLPVPDVCQLLVRWKTDTIAAGRRVRGRTFVPGLTVAAVSGGNVLATTVATVLAAATTLATLNGLVVWHRPKDILGVPTAPGSAGLVESAGVWNEWSYLSGRRG